MSLIPKNGNDTVIDAAQLRIGQVGIVTQSGNDRVKVGHHVLRTYDAYVHLEDPINTFGNLYWVLVTPLKDGAEFVYRDPNVSSR